MNKLLLLAFLVTLLALAAAGSQEEEEEEENALTRLAREAGPAQKNSKKKGRKPIKDKKARRKGGKKTKRLEDKKENRQKGKSDKKSSQRERNKGHGGQNKNKRRGGEGGRKKKLNKVKKRCGKVHDDRSRHRAVSSTSTCLIKAMTYLNLTRLQISNYLRQNTRMQKANSTGGKKSGKKGIFATTAMRMIKSGGGNKSALTCNGNTNTSGAAQMANVTNTLMGCEAKIKAACDTSSFPLPNMTVVTACVSAMKTFVGLVTNCMLLRNETAACSCWDSSDFTILANTTIRNCSISSENKLVTAQLKYCRGNFSACKQMEDDGMKAMSSCSQSTASLMADAAALTANSAGLAAAQNTTSSLTGNSTSGRRTRAVVTTCAAVISTIAKILVIVDQSTTSTQISTLAATVTGVSVTCTTTEISSLTTQATKLSAAKTLVDGNLATVQADLLTATGSTASSASISAAASATAAASARRNIVARHLLNRLNLN